MNFLFISDNYIPEMNANALIVSELSQHWSQNDHQVTVITSHPNFPNGKIFSGHKNVWRKTEIDGNIALTREEEMENDLEMNRSKKSASYQTRPTHNRTKIIIGHEVQLPDSSEFYQHKNSAREILIFMRQRGMIRRSEKSQIPFPDIIEHLADPVFP